MTLDDLRGPIPTGKRNNTLFRYGLEQASHADDYETLLDVMRTSHHGLPAAFVCLRSDRHNKISLEISARKDGIS